MFMKHLRYLDKKALKNSLLQRRYYYITQSGGKEKLKIASHKSNPNLTLCDRCFCSFSWERYFVKNVGKVDLV